MGILQPTLLFLGFVFSQVSGFNPKIEIKEMEQNQSLTQEITSLLAPILAEDGLELFEVEVKKSSQHCLFRIFLSHPERAITLGDCQKVSTALDLKMEVGDLFPPNTILEVSSVGLDRSLKRQKDFLYFRGEKVKVKTTRPLGEKKTFCGTISACDAKAVTLNLKDEKQIVIPYEIIKKAKLEIAF